MTEGDKMLAAAKIMARVAEAQCTAQGYTALNMQRESLGHSMAYDDEAFVSIIETCGIGHNAVVLVARGDA